MVRPHYKGGERQEDAKQAGCRGRHQAGAPFSAKQTKEPRILLADGILTRKPANSNDPMDSAIGRISRVSGPVDARVTAEHDPPWNFMPLYGMVTSTPEKNG